MKKIEQREQKSILRGSAIYLTEKGLLKDDSSPYLMLNMHFLCNYRCLKCCNITTESQLNVNQEPMSSTMLQMLLEEAEDAAFKVMILAGEGEPLLNKEFRTFITLAARNNLIPYIFSNGTPLNPDNINFLAENNASLIISLDSMNTLRYRRLTGGHGSLEQVLSNINLCRSVYSSLQEETSFGKAVSLAINTVVTGINMDEIEDIRRFCADDIVFVCNRPTRVGLAEKNWALLYGNSTENSDIDAVIEHYSKNNGPIGSLPDGQWCAHMKNGVSVGYDGSYLACAYATDTAGFFGNYKQGNLRQVNKLIMDSVEYFYLQYGHSRCILRHPFYKDWVLSNKIASSPQLCNL